MPHVRFARARRFLGRALVAALLIVLLSIAAFLPFAGRYLVAEDPLQKSDAIFVLAGARVERWVEAADLYRDGWAPRIVLSPGRVEQAEHQLRARGVRYPADAELSRGGLIQLGVPEAAVTILPVEVDNTAEEAEALRRLVTDTGWRSVIVVTSMYHTRRARFAFGRAFGGSGVRTSVRATRHGSELPDRWWRDRSDLRFVLWELQKLVAYRLGLGG